MQRPGGRVAVRTDHRDLARPVQDGLGDGQPPPDEARRPAAQRLDDAEGALGGVPVRGAAGQRRVRQERAGGRGPSGGRGVVRGVLGAADQLLGVVGGVEERAVLGGEVHEHGVQEEARELHPDALPGDRGERDETLGDVRVVLQDTGVGARDAVPRGAVQPCLPVHVDTDEQVGGVRGGLDQVRAVEVGAGLGEGRDGQAVPGGDDLVVPAGARPGVPGRAQPLLDARDPLGVHQVVGVGELQDGGALLEGALRCHAEVVRGDLGVLLPQDVTQLPGRPHVVRAFDVPAAAVVGVGVQRGGESALVRTEFPHHELGGLDGDPAGQVRPGGAPQVRVRTAQQRVVVQHLLEVRHRPRLVHRVAREAAAQLVVDPAAGHRLRGRLHHLQGRLGPRTGVVAQQEFQRHGRRELGRATESAVHGVEVAGQREQRVRQVLRARRHRFPLGQRRGERPRGQVGDDPPGDLAHLVPAVRPGAPHALEDLREGRHPVARFGREVRPEVERLALGRQEDGHRPATLPGGGLHGLHVDGVHVGPLLAVHLDRHEVLVDHGGDRLVLEAFVRHHMTPVTRGVTDRQQNGHITPPRFLESLRRPGPPVDRIVRVLKQIRRGHASQPVHTIQPLTVPDPAGEARTGAASLG